MRHAYKEPNTGLIDRENKFPRRHNVPKIDTGPINNGRLGVKHISRLTTQSGEMETKLPYKPADGDIIAIRGILEEKVKKEGE